MSVPEAVVTGETFWGGPLDGVENVMRHAAPRGRGFVRRRLLSACSARPYGLRL
jgi:hypothetical protein